MQKVIKDIKLIYIEEGIKNHNLTERFINAFNSAQIEYIDSYTQPFEYSTLKKQKFSSAKKTIILADNKGSFVKRFYLHPSLRGKPIYSINHSIGCIYDCKYCYLQAYQDYPAFVQFVNLEKIPSEIENIIHQSQGDSIFFSSGIFSDSLLFDDITGLCAYIFPIFASSRGIKLEIRSRTTNIEHLLNPELPKDNIILSWSLSPEEIIKKYEPRTPSDNQRIKAAAVCQRAGYNIGFHLDPLIHYQDWEKGYRNLIMFLKSQLNIEGIQYIFLGSLRFKRDWAKLFRIRFPRSSLLLDEFVPSKDGKFRYFKPIRLEMFCQLAKWVQEWSSDITLYLAMEPHEVWRKWEEHIYKTREAKISCKT